jgi:hypothetical protein
VVAWVGVLVVTVGLAVLGRPSEAVPAVAVGASPAAGASAGMPAAVVAPLAVSPVVERLAVTAPSMRGLLIGTRAIDIAGTVRGSGPVIVTLESRNQHILESRTIEVQDGPFVVSFDLPNPRPGGRMFVSAVLIGLNGVPVEAIRRSFESGPLKTPPMGEDGLVGGIEVESGT